MKNSSSILKKILPLSLLALISIFHNGYAQSTERQEKENARVEALKKIIEDQHYVFVAQSTTPMNGRTRQLTSTYQVKVTKDTIDSDLPYFGRAYTAPIGETQGGIYFTTKDFEYSKKDGTKGGWDIIIAPKNVKNVDRMILNISNSGYGTLQVTSNTRQMISFYGQVREM